MVRGACAAPARAARAPCADPVTVPCTLVFAMLAIWHVGRLPQDLGALNLLMVKSDESECSTVLCNGHG